ncbi:hypothetical protein [Pedobacter nyackensis]|uniref:hypothetical protein n=1 Tax=Pedobacter nyackensis TaxID=475255 RepID=UPI00292DFA8B|nr:hypothetical protein [Pedobacter nyackensis]
MDLTIKRLCIDCNCPLQGRLDKKFCNDHCRSNYNNRIRAESNGAIKSVNLILKKNRDILERFNPNGRIKINRIKLLSAGFDPNYHTHTHYSKKGGLYIFCYEYGYKKLETDEFLLIKNLLP